MTHKKENVLQSLKAFASGFGVQSEEMLYNFYTIAYNCLESDAEKKAFHQGALSLSADAGKMQVSRFLHKRQYDKAMAQL